MFDNLSDKLNTAFKKIRGQTRLNESNIHDSLRDVRLALLEADVNFNVVKDFIERVHERCLGQDILRSLTPGQQVVKIVYDEMVELLGGESVDLELRTKGPTVLMLVGLQGSGKTTNAAKLALFLRKRKLKPFLVPADVYRPAAIDQLQTLARSLDIPSYASTVHMSPMEICQNAMIEVIEHGYNVCIIDTAGRLHIDETLMQELVSIKAVVSPNEILLVADAMTGQDAVNIADRFNKLLDLTGIVLTKMDGDVRGGAALSIKSVTGKPIKFIGVGEKLSDLEIFHPDRIVNRIMGMGDILALIEKAQSAFKADEAEALVEKMRKAEFNLEDFLFQMRRLKKLGSLEGLLKLIPGMGGMSQILATAGDVPEKKMAMSEAIILSMTLKERRYPKCIDQSRKNRIARGSGTTSNDVMQLLKNFDMMHKMMKRMLSGGTKGKLPRMPYIPDIAHLGVADSSTTTTAGLNYTVHKKKIERKKKRKR
ncbi:signal recognition particle protein component [Desulfovibrionales bacterium]